MRISGIVTAAGLSSRMGAFKPLLDLNGFSMVEMAVNSLKNAGVSPVCVVTGKNADQVEGAMAHLQDLVFVRNEDFADTDMLHSIRLGLEQVSQADAVMILPADMPLVQPATLCALRRAAEHSDASVYYALYQGRRGHPPLIRSRCFDAILSFRGEGGLRAVLADFSSEAVETDDAAVHFDADFAADYETLRAEAQRRRGLAPAVCEALYEQAELLPHIRAHCRAVGALAEHIARALIAHGYCLDAQLCYSGGALHDILRLTEQHSREGSALLRGMGFNAAADMVLKHNFIERDAAGRPLFSEQSIVCLADKLVRETERVTVDRRYEKVLEMFKPDTEIGQKILENIALCRVLIDEFEKITGERLQ